MFEQSCTKKEWMKEDHIFCLFVHGITQGNEDAGWVLDFIFLFFVLTKGIMRERKSKISLHKTSVKSFSIDLLWAITNYWADAYLEHLRCSFYVKIINGFKMLDIRKVLLMWYVARLCVYGTCSLGLVHREVLEILLVVKFSCFPAWGTTMKIRHFCLFCVIPAICSL